MKKIYSGILVLLAFLVWQPLNAQQCVTAGGWTNVYTNQGELGSNFVQVTVDLSSFSTASSVKLRFAVDKNAPGSQFYNDILLDDVAVGNSSGAASYIESFDGSTTPTGWTQYGGDVWEFYPGDPSPSPGYDASGTPDHTGNGGSYAWVDGSSPSNVQAYLESPAIDISSLTSPTLTFWVFSTNTTYTSNGFNTFTCDVQPITCAPPTGLAVNSTTSTSASISFTAGSGSATAWRVTYNEPGSSSCTNLAFSSTSGTISGLNPGTTYEVYVEEVCSGGATYSAADGPVSFSTDCPSAFSAPYSTSFEAPGVGDPCWTQDTNDDGDWLFDSSSGSTTTGPDAPFDGNQYMHTDDSPGDINIINSPIIDLSPLTNNPTARFNYHMFGAQTGSLDLEVEIPAGSGNWVLIWSEIGNQGDQWLEAIVPLPAAAAGQNVVFRLYAESGGITTGEISVDNFSVENEFCVTPFDVVIDPQGLFADVSWTTLNADSVDIAYRKVGSATWDSIKGLTSSNFTIFGLDEQSNYELTITAHCSSTGSTSTTQVFNFTTPIACPDPNGGSSSNVTTNSADLSWNSGGSSVWDIQYGSSGFTLGQGVVVAGVTSNPYTLGNISPGTNYEWYVRDDCGPNGTSDWAGPFSFTTAPVCAPGTRKVIINVTTGSYGYESYWTITNSSGAIVASGGIGGVYAWNTSYQQEACLSDGEVYTFNAYDTYGDGWNGGSYSVVCESSGTILANNGGANPDNGTNPPTDDLEVSEDFQTDFCDCTNASGLTLAGVTGTSASVVWTAGGQAAGPWTLVYGAAGFNPSTGGTQVTGLTSPNYTVTGLTANSNYDIYVAEDCGGLLQGWVGPLAVSTPISCAAGETAVSIQINTSSFGYEVFWEIVDGGGTVYASGGQGGAYASSASYSYQACLPDGVPLFFNAWDTYGDGWNGGTYSVVCSNGSVLADNGGATPNNGTNPPVDDLEVSQQFSTIGCICPAPTGITASNVTGSSAMISWDAIAAAGDYTVEWGLSPLTAGSGTMVGPVSGTSTTITGLPGSTSIDVIVYSNCSGSITNPSSPANFQTACGAVVAPYTENFDNTTVWGPGLNTIDQCWTVESTTAPNWEVDYNGTGSSTTGPENDATGTPQVGRYIFLETSSPAQFGQSGWIQGPAVDVSGLTDPGITFQYHMYGSTMGTLNVQARSAGSGPWTTVWSLSGQQQTSDLASWLPGEASLVGFGNLIEFRFLGETAPPGTSGQVYWSDMAVDDVQVKNVLICAGPTNVTISNVWDNSADISWTASVSGNSYTLEIVPSGQAPTGSGVSVTGTSYSATGLTPETGYDVYVYTECGFAQSMGGQASFSTGYCPPPVIIPFSALPYTEPFDALAAPKIPCGWLVDDQNADNIIWETQDRSSLSQSNPNALEITRNTALDMDDWIFSPEFEVPANTSLDITFSYRVRTNQYVEKLEVYVGNAQNPAGMNLKLFDVSNLQNSFYKTVTVSYTATAAENIFIGIRGYSDADQFALYIDDFEVKEADCPTPFLLSAVSTGQTSAQLSWNGPGNNFIVEYGPAGFAPGTGTTVLASSSPIDITGLEVGADYEFYVQNDCNASGDGTSQVAGPAFFTTDCPSITASSLSSCPDGGLIQLTGSPAGGTISGPGVSGGMFDPTSVQPGTYTISYRVPNAYGTSCAGTIDITVNPFPNVVFGDLGTYCDGQNGFTITTASPTGGVFSGPGIVGTDFVPAQIGVPGTYTLYYSYTDANGCSAMDSASVSLIPTPNVNLNASRTSFCGPNDSTVTLNGTPAGGVYSGPGVVNGTFNPAIAGVGTHTVRYTVTSGSCSTQDVLVMRVNQVPSVVAAPDSSVVLYGQALQLSAVATGGSGNYTYQWSPADSILGTGIGNQVTSRPLSVPQQFTVQVTDNVTGCIGYDTVYVDIFGGPISIVLSSNKDTICVGESVELYADIDGGSDTTYSFLWTPSSYVTDMHNDTTSSSPIVTTTYSFYVDDSFSQKVEHITIYVEDLPTVNFAPVANPCVDGAAMMLTQGSPAGGTYSGPGVTGGMFDPAAAGAGTHVLTYTYMNAAGCEASATRSVIVSPAPSATIGTYADVCLADAPFALTGGFPKGGVYSGAGVSNGMFDPAAAGEGTWTITYTVTNANGCTGVATTTITVNPAAIGFHLPIAPVCTDNGPLTLVGAIPPGGTYTGPGVNSGVFYPSQVGPGTYTLDYETVSVTGCPISFQTTIVVNAVPSVSTSNFANTCASAAPITLSGATPAGGTWSGAGVSAGSFDPSVAGAGTHVLTYTYTDPSGCDATGTSTITVEPAPNVSLNTVSNACVAGGNIPLISGSPAGGTYSGPGVTGNSFDPSAAGVGTHTITYSYTNAQGCSGTATSTITVDDSPSVSFSAVSDVCKNSASVALSGTPAGGTFSGPGVAGGSFNPSLVQPGTYTLTYSYTDGNGCSGSATQSVTVDPLPAAPTISQNGCDLVANSSASSPTYTWLDNQGNVVGTGATFTTPCVGLNVYFLQVEDGTTGCSSTSSQFVASYVSIEDELTNETIEVYPNPNRGSFSLSISQLSATDVNVVITDARGRIVLEEEVDHVSGSSFDRDYELAEVENGVYFIRVTADGHSSVKRIVIEK